MYGGFLSYVMNQPKKGQELINRAEELEDQRSKVQAKQHIAIAMGGHTQSLTAGEFTGELLDLFDDRNGTLCCLSDPDAPMLCAVWTHSPILFHRCDHDQRQPNSLG